MDFPRTSRRIRALNLVPLIDVIFTLILFFMIAGHMEKFAAMPVELPKAESGQAKDQGPIEIVLSANRDIAINDTRVTVAEVPATIRRQLAADPERMVTVKADARLDANALVDMLEVIRAAGGKNLSLVTQVGAVGV